MTTKTRGLASNPLFEKTDQPEPTTVSHRPEETGSAQAEPKAQQSVPNPTGELAVQGTEESNEYQGDSQDYEWSEPAHDQPGDGSNASSIAKVSKGPADRSISQSISRPTRQVIRRPTAFYLYEDQSEELDDLVGHLRKKYKIKTDRSALLRAILTRPLLDYHDESKHQELIERLLAQATSRLISR